MLLVTIEALAHVLQQHSTPQATTPMRVRESSFWRSRTSFGWPSCPCRSPLCCAGHCSGPNCRSAADRRWPTQPQPPFTYSNVLWLYPSVPLSSPTRSELRTRTLLAAPVNVAPGACSAPGSSAWSGRGLLCLVNPRGGAVGSIAARGSVGVTSTSMDIDRGGAPPRRRSRGGRRRRMRHVGRMGRTRPIADHAAWRGATRKPRQGLGGAGSDSPPTPKNPSNRDLPTRPRHEGTTR